MIAKLVIVGTVLMYCNAQHHALSSQSVVHHVSHHEKQLHAQPIHLLAAPAHQYQPHQAPSSHKGHAVSSQTIHLAQHAPSHAPHGQQSYGPSHHEEEYGHPAYEFKYSVHDPHTGDDKSQSESRDGDAVKGEYTLLQPDGQIRKVTYTADKHSGFNAHVSYTHAGHPGH